MNVSAQALSATADLFQQAADDLDAEAVRHKRAEAFHRSQARAARQRQERLVETCRELGIRLVIRHGHSPEGGTDR